MSLKDKWPVSEFDNNNYHLQVHGPNGFFREFNGNGKDPAIEILCNYEVSKLNTNKLTVTFHYC
ncbi:MAG: phospholipase domain-containing protein [Bacteroidota bacterium]